MLIITAQVDAPSGQAIGVKEALAMQLERFGDTRIVSVVEKPPAHMEQLSMVSANGSLRHTAQHIHRQM